LVTLVLADHAYHPACDSSFTCASSTDDVSALPSRSNFTCSLQNPAHQKCAKDQSTNYAKSPDKRGGRTSTGHLVDVESMESDANMQDTRMLAGPEATRGMVVDVDT